MAAIIPRTRSTISAEFVAKGKNTIFNFFINFWQYHASSPNMHPNMPNMAKYAYLGAYLGAPHKVKWGVPEKILQNAVQTRWS